MGGAGVLRSNDTKHIQIHFPVFYPRDGLQIFVFLQSVIDLLSNAIAFREHLNEGARVLGSSNTKYIKILFAFFNPRDRLQNYVFLQSGINLLSKAIAFCVCFVFKLKRWYRRSAAILFELQRCHN